MGEKRIFRRLVGKQEKSGRFEEARGCALWRSVGELKEEKNSTSAVTRRFFPLCLLLLLCSPLRGLPEAVLLPARGGACSSSGRSNARESGCWFTGEDGAGPYLFLTSPSSKTPPRNKKTLSSSPSSPTRGSRPSSASTRSSASSTPSTLPRSLTSARPTPSTRQSTRSRSPTRFC